MKTNHNALVFDWNCTLLDDFDITHHCMNSILVKLGRAPITADHLRTHYDIPFERLYLNLGFSQDEIEEVMKFDKATFHVLYEEQAVNAGLREGAEKVIARAKENNTATVILSNHIVDAIYAQLRRLAIAHLFDDVLAHADQETQFCDIDKGERLRRYRAAQVLAPHSTIIVGDSVEEIEIAQAQDLISVAITGGGVSETRLRAAKPDYIIHALPELMPILEERGFVS